jgi:dTDP-4-dehydrorhamnose reductase
VYGASKLAGENAVRASGGLHLIIRTSWVYATHGSNFLRTIGRLACEQEELRVVADQIGSPTSAAYLTEAVYRILTTDQGDIVNAFLRMDRSINVAPLGETSWHNFAEAIVAGLALRRVPLKVRRIVPIASHEYPTKATRPLNSRLDLTRALEARVIDPVDWRIVLGRELDRM